MTKVTFDLSRDIVTEENQTLTSGIWSEGASSLTSFFTSSTQSSSNGQYFLQVYNKDTSDSTSAKQFAVMYGHKGGSGSLGAPGTAGGRDTAAVYGQLLNLTQPAETELFDFGSSTVETKQHIYGILFDRSRMREKVDPGNWELVLAGPNGSATQKLSLIDDSSTNTSTINDNGVTEYNVVTGSIQGGSTTIVTAASSMGASTGSFGKFYPDFGLIVLNANALEKSQIGSLGAAKPAFSPYFEFGQAHTGGTSYTGSNTLHNVASHSLHRFVDSLNSGSLFQARREEVVSSTHYFCRVMNDKFNRSNNPTWVTGSDGSPRIESFRTNPKTYITTVGLYNDSNELLAVAKLSQPILKSKSREALIKVKLDF
tara:strand:+ start:618 stop:1727 length:1110 start_codon:yes stop_codon:yes gene_type:complete